MKKLIAIIAVAAWTSVAFSADGMLVINDNGKCSANVDFTGSSVKVAGVEYSTATDSATANTIMKRSVANQVAATTFIGALTGNASTATTLATPRAIYGNNFNGSAALDQVIGSAYGGTGNGYTKFTGATTAEKTYTLPNASCNILTDNAAVSIGQGGTGAATASAAKTALGIRCGISDPMTSGVVVVRNSGITASSRICVSPTVQAGALPMGSLAVDSQTAGWGFSVTSSSNTDTAWVNWIAVEP